MRPSSFFFSFFFCPPFPLEGIFRYKSFSNWSWLSICWLCKSLLDCLSHPTPSSTCCELQQIRWHYSGVISSLMRLDCQLRALNAEVTASLKIAPPPCPHSCFPVLVLFFGTTGRAAFEGVLLFPSVTPVCRGRDGPRRSLTVALGLHYSSSNVSFFSAWALGLIWNWPDLPNLLAPQ